MLPASGMDMSQIGKVVFRVGDNNTPSIHEGDILLVMSGSGNTKTISIIAQEAKDFGAEVGLFLPVPSPSSVRSLITIS